MNTFWNDYPEMASQLEDVSAVMTDAVKNSDEFIRQAINDSVTSGGKMLRPAFLILAGQFGDAKKEDLTRLGAVIEMLHFSTLVHDDIIDDSKLRRGKESIQSKYGKDVAVFIGDYLFAKCFTMLSDSYKNEVLTSLSDAILNICKGELRQYRFRYDYDTRVLSYLKIISGKTAALFSMSFHIGAKEAGLDQRTIKRLGKIGYYIGMAFQIIDDCLDFSDNKIIKKSAMNDLKQGYLTLPVIYAIQNDSSGKLKEELEKSDFSKEEIQKIHHLVEENKGLEEARTLAKKYTKKAFKLIDTLPDTENKAALEKIIHGLLDRKY